MENHDYFDIIEQGVIDVNHIPTTEVSLSAVGIIVSNLPHREALFQIKRLLEEENDIEVEGAVPLYLCLGEQAPIQLGRIVMDVGKLQKLNQITLLVHGRVVALSNGQEEYEIVPLMLLHTLKVKVNSIYTRI